MFQARIIVLECASELRNGCAGSTWHYRFVRCCQFSDNLILAGLGTAGMDVFPRHSCPSTRGHLHPAYLSHSRTLHQRGQVWRPLSQRSQGAYSIVRSKRICSADLAGKRWPSRWPAKPKGTGQCFAQPPQIGPRQKYFPTRGSALRDVLSGLELNPPRTIGRYLVVSGQADFRAKAQKADVQDARPGKGGSRELCGRSRS